MHEHPRKIIRKSESPKDDKPSSKSTEKPGLKWTDLVYRDPGKHWCQVTTRWLSSFSALLSHLHSEEYHSKLPLKEKPWKKRLDLFNSTVRERDAIKESLNEPIELSKGSEFIVPIQVKVQNQNQNFKNRFSRASKVGCMFTMVIWSEFHMG